MTREKRGYVGFCPVRSVAVGLALLTWLCPVRAEDDDLLDPVSVYGIAPDDLSLVYIEGEDATDADTETWRSVLQLLPHALIREQVEEFHIFSDGEDETLSYVSLLESDDNRWVFAVDYIDAVDADEGQWVSTLTHEFAHLLGLGGRQLDSNAEQCELTYEVEEGCARPSSWIQAWFEQFWAGERFESHLERIGEGEVDLDALEAYYNDHYDAFVNEYAATNPVEDFAESFSYFVFTEPMLNSATEREQKVQFFYAYPELRAVRDHIRARTPVRRASINSDPK